MTQTAVVFCTDAAGLPFAAFAAVQIAKLHPGRRFDLVIVSLDALDLPSCLTAVGVKQLRLDPGDELKDAVAAGSGFLPPAAFLRIWLPAAMQARGYDRYIYLDIDVFPQTGSFDNLFAAPMGGFPIAAVRDLKQWTDLVRPIFEFEANGLGGLPYFNSGVMLIDVARWQELSVTQRFLAEAAKKPITYTHDQGLLNLALRGEWAELHPSWNWHMTREHHALFWLLRPRILHFAGWEKPYSEGEAQTQHDPGVVRSYAAFLAEHFPDRTIEVLAPAAKSSKLYRFAAALYSWYRMRPYLRRFRSVDDPLLPG